MISEVDVSGVQPEAREIVRRTASIVVERLAGALVSLVAHGSAVKGGFIAGCSDVDLSVLVAPTLLDEQHELPLTLSYALYRELSGIDPHPFRSIQAFAHPAGKDAGHGFVPGAYHVVWGDRRVRQLTAEGLQRSAHEALAQLDPAAYAARISRHLFARGRGTHGQELRFVCTDVWPVLYHMLTLRACLAVQKGGRARCGNHAMGLLRRSHPSLITSRYPTSRQAGSDAPDIQSGSSTLLARCSFPARLH